MNREKLISLASVAIASYGCYHGTSCYVCYENGKVIARRLQNAKIKPAKGVIVSPFGQHNGLAPAQWASLGNELFEQYTKELACQARQKP